MANECHLLIDGMHELKSVVTLRSLSFTVVFFFVSSWFVS